MLLIQLLTLAGGLLKAFGSTWDVLNPPGLKAVQGSCLYIPCTFTFPSDVIVSGNIVAIWYQENNYQTTVAYHSSSTEINDRFLGRTQLLGDPNEKNCTLLITNVAKEDAGKYTFRFEIDEVNRWLDKKGVFVTVSDDPEMPEITVPTEVLDGSPVSLSCRTPYFCPDDSISLEWKENIPEGSLITSTLRLDTAAVLNLQNLSTTFSWRHNQKTIQCQVSVGDARAAKEVTLDVKHSPKGTEVIISPNRDNIKQSDRASLACHVNSSNPAVTGYKWFKDGSTKAFSTEQLVSFQSVTRSDYGQYSCEAENAIGTGVAQGTTLTIFCNCTNTPTDGWRENGNFLYYFSQQLKNWNDAEKFCVSQNSHLTSITSPEEQGYLATMRGTADYWIGLTDQASEGTWYFVDGSPYKLHTFWAPNQPDNWLTPQGERENCAKIYRDDLWNDIVCSVELRWICKKSCMLK